MSQKPDGYSTKFYLGCMMHFFKHPCPTLMLTLPSLKVVLLTIGARLGILGF